MVKFAKIRIAIVAALVCAASVAHARRYTPEMDATVSPISCR